LGLDVGQLFQIWPHLSELVGVLFVGAAAAGCLRLFLKPEKPEKVSNAPLLFVAVWSAFCIGVFSLKFHVQGNPRYLMTPLIPVTLLGFLLYAKATSALGKIPSRVIHTVFIVLTLIAAQSHFDEIVWHRNFYGGVEIADYKLSKKLYEDKFKDSNASWAEIDNLFRGKGLLSWAESGEIKIKEWDANIRTQLQDSHLQGVASRWGGAYILSFKSDLFENNSNASIIFKTDTTNNSVFSWVLPKVKKKAERSAYLYKYTVR
jgi:hypothetical protein